MSFEKHLALVALRLSGAAGHCALTIPCVLLPLLSDERSIAYAAAAPAKVQLVVERLMSGEVAWRARHGKFCSRPAVGLSEEAFSYVRLLDRSGKAAYVLKWPRAAHEDPVPWTRSNVAAVVQLRGSRGSRMPLDVLRATPKLRSVRIHRGGGGSGAAAA